MIFYPQTSDNKNYRNKMNDLGGIQMLPEELARIKIDKQLQDAGWDIVSRMEYIPNTTSAVKEALMKGSKESDYLLFVEDKAIAVVEAKKEDNMLGEEVALQAENYAATPQTGMGYGFQNKFHWSIWQMGKSCILRIFVILIVIMKKFLLCTHLSRCLK